jgi:hypothetical protein
MYVYSIYYGIGTAMLVYSFRAPSGKTIYRTKMALYIMIDHMCKRGGTTCSRKQRAIAWNIWRINVSFWLPKWDRKSVLKKKVTDSCQTRLWWNVKVSSWWVERKVLLNRLRTYRHTHRYTHKSPVKVVCNIATELQTFDLPTRIFPGSIRLGA